MNHLNRRHFLKSLGGLAAVSAFPGILRSATGPRVVVVGGGFAGSTAAKYLKHWQPDLQVTLVEPNAAYQSPIMSNLIVNGQMNLSQITFNYQTLTQKYGVQVIQDWVAGLDGVNKTVTLQSGSVLEYDRLIIAPGIAFSAVPGLDFNKVPHAWQSGEQVLQLKQELDAMAAGGAFVMTIPKAPYRCPPGPYERACVVADYLKTNKPGSTVLVLDANADILAEKEAFSHAFNNDYAGIIDYRTNVELLSVDSDQKIATTSAGDFQADVLNVIPQQQAGSIITSNSLANDATGRWASVDPLSYESTAVAGIHVIGDSQATNQPKAGHIANAEAKICADAVIRLLNGDQPYAEPMTNSACYSPISTNSASWATVVYRYDTNTQTMKPVPGSGGAATIATTENYQAMFDWVNNLFADTFS